MAVLLFAVMTPVWAQETDLGYNPNSIRPIHENDIMYKKRVWRRMDLKEKQNKGFFATNNQITKIMIDAVNAGTLTPYVNDTLITRMTKEEFLENLKLPDEGGGLTEEEKALGFTEDDGGWGDDSWGGEEEGEAAGEGEEAAAAVDEGAYFFPNQITILEIMEDIIFDRKRSRLYYDVQAVTMIIPASEFPSGLQKSVAVFKYKDLAELFQSMPDEAIWFNRENSREHKNLADAFDLRLFSARIIKVENPDNNFITDVYDETPKQGVMASQWLEDEIIGYEHDLWEF